MEVGQVGRLGPYLTAPVVQMLMNVDGSQRLDPALVQHQRMEEMIVLVTARSQKSVHQVNFYKKPFAISVSIVT